MRNPSAIRWLAIRINSEVITRRYLRALRHFHACERLHGADVGEIIGHAGEVVEAVGQGDDLRVAAFLRELGTAAMEIAEDRLDVHDFFAIEEGTDAEDAVRRRVLRPEVEQHRLDVAVVGRFRVGWVLW